MSWFLMTLEHCKEVFLRSDRLMSSWSVLENEGNAICTFAESKCGGHHLMSLLWKRHQLSQFVSMLMFSGSSASSQLAPSISIFKSFNVPWVYKALSVFMLPILNQVRQEFRVSLAEKLVAFARQPHQKHHGWRRVLGATTGIRTALSALDGSQ